MLDEYIIWKHIDAMHSMPRSRIAAQNQFLFCERTAGVMRLAVVLFIKSLLWHFAHSQSVPPGLCSNFKSCAGCLAATLKHPITQWEYRCGWCDSEASVRTCGEACRFSSIWRFQMT